MKQFTIMGAEVQVVEVPGGARGARGLKGDAGDTGPQGNSINVRGQWSSLIQYAPLDAVIAPATASAALTSLYVHRSGAGAAPVGAPPASEPSFWAEVGIGDLGLSIGGVWRVRQVGHGFTRVGTPVTVSAGVYSRASANTLANAAVAVVREIIDADTITLQSDGFIPAIDPVLNLVAPSAWVDGASYWLSLTDGRVTDAAPGGAIAQIVYRIVEVHPDGTADAIVVLTNDLPINPPPAPQPPASTTNVKVDDVSPLFDGVTRQFPLEVLGAQVPWPVQPESVQVHVDGNPQEPQTDFILLDDGVGGTLIQFSEAPQSYEEFWGIYVTALGVASTVGIGPAFPVGAVVGALWYLTDGPVGLYLRVDDGTSVQWVMVDSLGDV